MLHLPLTRHKTAAFIQTFLLLVTMVAFLALLGLVIAGVDGIFFSLLLGIFLILLYPSVDAALLARFFGAQPLSKEQAGMLYGYLEELKSRGDLPALPRLYLLPGEVMTAFTVGKPDNAALILSSALIRRLTLPETVAVMAHEVAHIVNRDLWLMSLTDVITRLMALLSVIGQTMVLLFLPFYFLAGVQIPWGGILVLVFAPIVGTLLQLSLSRVREYDADLTAAYLTGDPGHLASALSKIDYAERGLLESLFLPTRVQKVPSLFRTHPPTEKRIKRLAELHIPGSVTPLVYAPYSPHDTPDSDISAIRVLVNYLLGHWH